MKTIIDERESILERAAEHIGRLLKEKPDAVIALSDGEACLALCERLAQTLGREKISLADARFFAVSELDELAPGAGLSARERLERAFFSRTDARPEKLRFLTGETLADYDGWIAAAGGLDLAVPDLGRNARIGYNEPATPFDSRCRRQKLSPATRRELAERFGGEAAVPVYGLTMGVKTLTEAREILVVSLGEDYAAAVFDMLYGRDDSAVPAAFLQLPPNVTVYADRAAAARL